jgi:hypothetical protein
MHLPERVVRADAMNPAAWLVQNDQSQVQLLPSIHLTEWKCMIGTL